jgi:hypothetical protein
VLPATSGHWPLWWLPSAVPLPQYVGTQCGQCGHSRARERMLSQRPVPTGGCLPMSVPLVYLVALSVLDTGCYVEGAQTDQE